jgi:hypothetical protein
MSESLIEKRNLDELWCDFLDVTYPKLDECSEIKEYILETNKKNIVYPWIQTYSNYKFDFVNLDTNIICIRDIAHALSNICRYTGHTNEFYSVAQHSVLASHIVPEEDALTALLHDATEAYLSDISKPLKLLLPEYKVLEDRVWLKIAERFNLPGVLPVTVKQADIILLATEKRDLLGKGPEEWEIIKNIPCMEEEIIPLSPREAETLFRERIYQIKEK